MQNTTLAICEKVRGKEHPATLRSSSNAVAAIMKSMADVE
jgi:hypothetical protein